ncbi:hypothetical protein QQP08_025208 [Theobroma cacao]|nr:hypothetical protein QQP08_025208 [Theobroma cacao]
MVYLSTFIINKGFISMVENSLLCKVNLHDYLPGCSKSIFRLRTLPLLAILKAGLSLYLIPQQRLHRSPT